jgi:4-hydroxyacetophenone monooxygenase
MQCLRELIEHRQRAKKVRREVHDAYNKRVDTAHERMVVTHPGMSTWYRNSRGRVTTHSPWRLAGYWKVTAKADIAEYELS